MSTVDKSTLAKIENYFKTNIGQMIQYLASNFSCSKTSSQLKLLESIVFPSQSFTSQMILQWHKNMEPFYASVERDDLESMIESKSVWFLERIDFADKWPRIQGEDRVSLIQYFKGLNKLAKNYAMFNSQELAALIASVAAAKAPEIPEMPEDAKLQAEWIVGVTQSVVGSLTSEQVAQIVAQLPAIVEAMGGAEAVIAQARVAKVEQESAGGVGEIFSGLLNPDMIRALVGGLSEQVKDVTVPGKTGEMVALSSLVGDTSKVLTDLVEGKADTSQVAGLGQKLTEEIDWDSIMSMLPPEMSTMGRQLMGHLTQTTKNAQGGEGEAAEPVDVSKVMDTVSTLATSLFSDDSPFSGLISGLMQQASQPGAENPLAKLMKKE